MRYLLFILFNIVFLVSYGQSAREIFKSATEAFEKGNYQTALNHLDACERALGKTNPRIESLRAYCYSNLRDWKNAYVAVNAYFRIAPPSNYGTTPHKDLEKLKSYVETRLVFADELFKQERNRKRMQEAERFESQQERLATTRTNTLKKESESKLYALYKNSTDPKHLEQYLKMFPNSSHKKEMEFKKYVAAGDQDMKAKRWTPAVRNYTKALEITNDATVRTKLRNARDEQAFATTTQKNTIDSYENYLSDFPSGLHKKEADRVLQLSYLAVARTYVKEK